jgi:hypothetical protein
VSGQHLAPTSTIEGGGFVVYHYRGSVLDGEESGEIPLFARFMVRRLALPASEYLNLNPNGIFHVSVFIHFCEAFVGIKPHWILFRKFFWLKPQPSTNDP